MAKQCSIMQQKMYQDQYSRVEDGRQWKGNESSWNWMQFLCCIFGRLQNQCVSQTPVAPSKSFKSVFTINLGDIDFIEFEVIEHVCMVFSYFSYTWEHTSNRPKSTFSRKILNHLGVLISRDLVPSGLGIRCSLQNRCTTMVYITFFTTF